MSKHTPGPWQAVRWIVTTSVDCQVICSTGSNKQSRNDENAANARLIAAAPDLLAACKALIEVVDRRGGMAADRIIAINDAANMARVAIRKAEGTS